jgi:dual specificity tyrosine-phosphorylation-regulated kinase 2/3/4
LVELLIGHPLFNGGNEHEQLCKYFELLGRPSDEFLRSASQEKISRFFLLDPATSKYSLQIAPGFIPRQDGTDLTEIIMGKCPHDAGNSQKQNYQTFVDFISKILVYDPAKRLAPADALQHPFLYRSRSTNTPTHYTMDNLNSSTDFIGSLCVKMRKL